MYIFVNVVEHYQLMFNQSASDLSYSRTMWCIYVNKDSS